MAGELITEGWQVEYAGVVFGVPTGREIVTMDLFSAPSIRTNDVARPQGHGNFQGDDWYGSRTFNMDIEVWGYSESDLHDRLNDVLRATTIQEEPLPLVVRIPGRSEDILLFARPIQRSNVLDIETVVGNIARFSLQWRADDPRLYAADESTLTLELQAGSEVGGQFDAGFPYSFGGVTSVGAGSANNTGTIESLPVVTITGSINNPTVRAIGPSGVARTMEFNVTLGDGQELVIDMARRTINLNGVSAYSVLADTASWFGLEPGLNSISFSGIEVAGDTPTASIVWRSASV